MPVLHVANQGQGQCDASAGLMRYTVPSFFLASETLEASESKCVITLKDIPDHDYCLSNAIAIEIEKEEEGYVISQPDTGVFVYHSNLGVALDHFYSAFIEQYEFLKNNAPQLSPSLKRDLQRFESFVKPC